MEQSNDGAAAVASPSKINLEEKCNNDLGHAALQDSRRSGLYHGPSTVATDKMRS
eukprot:SAG11_NODE_596_length_8299_cov_12.479512_3_plen_55_part_00